MNDDVDAAEAGLSEGNSSFHKVGRLERVLRGILETPIEVLLKKSKRGGMLTDYI